MAESTNQHKAIVMVQLALIEGRWQLDRTTKDRAGNDEPVTGSNFCVGGCGNHAHKPLPSMKQLASLLAETTETEGKHNG